MGMLDREDAMNNEPEAGEGALMRPESVDNAALAVQERAQIDMQITTAKRYPRTLSKVKADMLSFATLDEDTASACFYTLPRGNKVIQGPSIRMAEIAVACYGNMRAGVRCVETVTTGGEPHVVLQAITHDLEKNVAVTIEKRRRIIGKKSKGGRIDEDDINLAVNAGAAIAFRDAVFKVVPQALIKPVWQQAKKVAVGDVKSLTTKRQQVVDRLKQMGVDEARMLAVVDCRKVEDIGMDHLEVLIGLGTAIKDGETTIEEAFPPAQSAPASTAPQQRVPAKAAEPAKVPAPTPAKPKEDDLDMGPTPEEVEAKRVEEEKANEEKRKQEAELAEQKRKKDSEEAEKKQAPTADSKSDDHFSADELVELWKACGGSGADDLVDTLTRLNMLRKGQDLSSLAQDRIDLYANNVQKIFAKRAPAKK